ncbi:MAG: hypothetical protein ACK56I_35215, partial [bacterium]
MSNHAVLSPHVKRFSPAGSRQLKLDGATPPLFSFFYKPIQSVRSYRYTGEKLSCLVSIESFEFLTPL